MNTDLEDIILYLNANEPTGKFAKQIERLKLIVEAFDVLSLAYGKVYEVYAECGGYAIEDCSDGYKQFSISNNQATTLLSALNLYKQKTLRNYINNNFGEHNIFVFVIDERVFNTTSVGEFERYYNSKLLDEYCVVVDNKHTNGNEIYHDMEVIKK